MFGRPPIEGVAWLVLVDGLDEIRDQQHRRHVLRKVVDFQGSPEYRFIVTSRPVADLALIWRGDLRPTFVIKPFDRDGLREFAHRWFAELGHPDPSASGQAFLARVDRTKLRDLARVPLISTMLVVLFDTSPHADLPNNQAELYDQFVSWLMGKLPASDMRARLRARAARYGPVAERAVGELVDGLENLLQDLAYARQGLDGARWPENTLVTERLAARPEGPATGCDACRRVGRPDDRGPSGKWSSRAARNRSGVCPSDGRGVPRLLPAGARLSKPAKPGRSQPPEAAADVALAGTEA